jgi:hypothetical protein
MRCSCFDFGLVGLGGDLLAEEEEEEDLGDFFLGLTSPLRVSVGDHDDVGRARVMTLGIRLLYVVFVAQMKLKTDVIAKKRSRRVCWNDEIN